MQHRLGETIAERRRRTFVGRASELELFTAAMHAAGSEFAVLHVHGAGGIGKSALLWMFVDLATAAGWRTVRVDGHDVAPNASAFRSAVGAVDGVGPLLMVVDTYELLEPLDNWLREDYVTGLPSGSIVVIAGRRPPAAGWRADPAWRDLVRVIALDGLAPGDAVRYLLDAGVPADLSGPVAAATHGRPLALGLSVDVLGQHGEAVLDDPDVLAVLVARLLDGVPDDLHRVALAACAISRSTTEASLRGVLDVEDARAQFAWLCGLSCMEAGPRGIYPHDLARDVIEAVLRWRDEDRYRALWLSTRARIAHRIRAGSGSTRRRGGGRCGVPPGWGRRGVLVPSPATLLPRHPHGGPAHLRQPGRVEAPRQAPAGHRAAPVPAPGAR